MTNASMLVQLWETLFFFVSLAVCPVPVLIAQECVASIMGYSNRVAVCPWYFHGKMNDVLQSGGYELENRFVSQDYALIHHKR